MNEIKIKYNDRDSKREMDTWFNEFIDIESKGLNDGTIYYHPLDKKYKFRYDLIESEDLNVKDSDFFIIDNVFGRFSDLIEDKSKTNIKATINGILYWYG